MTINPLKNLKMHGQSIWLDYIDRNLIDSGELNRFIVNDNISGITSNPSIFYKAISEGNEYHDEIAKFKIHNIQDPVIAYEKLTQRDISDAADILSDLYHNSQGQSGFVSLEVNPHYANDTQATIDEARRLWKTLGKKNVLIKVPGTDAGIPAITQLISEGINLNITLLFSLKQYEKVLDAYFLGLEKALENNISIDSIASVASFFLSRIDNVIDPLLEKIIHTEKGSATLAKELLGQVATASATMAYQIYLKKLQKPQIKNIIEKNGQKQKLVWASTSTKNPNYSDVKYVEALIGPDTINTLPLETLVAYRDHGNPSSRLEKGHEQAHWVFEQLPKLGIDIDHIAKQLEDDGVIKFQKAYDDLIQLLKSKL